VLLFPRTKLFSDQLWAKHEAHYLKVFLRALQFMCTRPSVPDDEIRLNRELYGCLLRAERELDPEGAYPPPMIECNNQPDLDDEARSLRETKRPDFTWGFMDPHEPDYAKSAKQFIIECKRLGSPLRSDWILNTNYVEHGIQRFIDSAWAYAKRFPSAAMVGYLQNMEPGEVLSEVNRIAATHGTPAIVISKDGWQIGGTSYLDHNLRRSFPISPLHLTHLWVDFRGKAFIHAGSVTNRKTKTKNPKRKPAKVI